MDQSTVAFWLSVGLAALKVYEVYSDRRSKIEANVRLTSAEDIGFVVSGIWLHRSVR